jgi:hypothetical protein
MADGDGKGREGKGEAFGMAGPNGRTIVKITKPW